MNNSVVTLGLPQIRRRRLDPYVVQDPLPIEPIRTSLSQSHNEIIHTRRGFWALRSNMSEDTEKQSSAGDAALANQLNPSTRQVTDEKSTEDNDPNLVRSSVYTSAFR